ncbi:MAG: HNH endonuclease [Nevskiales bacterium]
MSYESDMLSQFAMPTQKSVEQTLLCSLLKHGGTIEEFASGQKIVDEVAGAFGLSEQQRSAVLETIYRKQDRLKKSLLWHRLLFRAADSLAKRDLVSRPTQTMQLTRKREWMLTEKGFDEALKLSNIPVSRKAILPTKSFEVQKIVKKLIEAQRPKNYDPIDQSKPVTTITRVTALRERGFRQAVVEAYGYKCAICGLKIKSPDSLTWEVQAAHIVPNSLLGRDDIYNAIALCRLHHWAFDTGWFTLLDDYCVRVSKRVTAMPPDFGKMGGYEIFQTLASKRDKIYLPTKANVYPHHNAICWHRQNIFNE